MAPRQRGKPLRAATSKKSVAQSAEPVFVKTEARRPLDRRFSGTDLDESARPVAGLHVKSYRDRLVFWTAPHGKDLNGQMPQAQGKRAAFTESETLWRRTPRQFLPLGEPSPGGLL